MTESEWLASSNSAAMLRHVGDKVSARKLRLFACGCCRQVWDKLTDPRSRNAVEVAERYADGEATEAEIEYARGLSREVRCTEPPCMPCMATGCLNSQPWVTFAQNAWANRHVPRATQAALLRCIVGNPWRPVTLCGVTEGITRTELVPDCTNCAAILTHNGGTVRRLAGAIYADRAFDLLPVLADVLEEAGCEDKIESPCPNCRLYHDDLANPFRPAWGSAPGYHPERDPASGRHEGGWTNCKRCNAGGKGYVRAGVVSEPNPILAHCRVPGPHARGCWVLDLLLGKS